MSSIGTRARAALMALTMIGLVDQIPARGSKDIDSNFLAITDCPGEPGCPAMVLLDETELSNASARARLSRRRVLKLFTETGIAEHADVEVIETLGSEECRNLSGRTILPDGTVIPLKQEHIFVKPAYKKGALRMRMKTAKFPGVVPGAIIEYSYDLIDPRASYFEEWIWRVQEEDLPVLKAHLTLRPGEVPFAWHASGPEKTRIVHTHPFIYVHYFDAENLPSITDEAFSPPREELRTKLYLFRPTHQSTWLGRLARTFVWGTGDFLDKSLGIPEKVRELAPANESDLEKVKRVYRFVQEEIATDEERASRQEEKEVKDAENAGEVLERRYGNEFERTMLFLGMVRELALPVGLLVMADRRNTILNTDAPDERQLEAFGAAVKIGEDWTFYDPAVKHCPFGMISWFKEGGVPNAILVTPEKTSLPRVSLGATSSERVAALAAFNRLRSAPYMLAAVPFSKAADNVLLREATVRLGVDGSAEIDVTERTKGQTDLDRHTELEDRTDSERRAALTRRIHDTVPGAELISASFEGLGIFDMPLTIRYRLRMPAMASAVGDLVVLTPAIFSAAERNEFTAESRRTAVHFPHTEKSVDRITFELPEGHAVQELPGAAIVREGPFVLVTSLTQEAGNVVYSRRLELDAAMWPADRYPVLKAFFEKVQQADRGVVKLRRGTTP